ncbi:MAG: oligosaccharide flippase family protein [Candidatus Moraniibacteriota bacterium]|nr:MAG: oligosaccharide flippase family protein [Candidatus Moranbacteria bacterium]
MATLGKSFFWLFGAEFLFYLSGYVVHMGAGRILGVEDYGKYSLVITITLIIANLVGAGLPIAMGKFLSASYAKGDQEMVFLIKRRIALWQSIFMFLAGGIFFLSAPLLASFLGDSSLTELFWIASFIIPLYGADLYYFHYYSGLKYFHIQSILKFVRALLRMTVIIGLAYWFHLAGIIAGYLIVPFFIFLLAWQLDKERKFEKKDSKEIATFSFHDVLSLAGATTIFLVIFEILISFDMYVLKYTTGDDVLVGEYSSALTIARIPTFLFYALTIILLPTISEARVFKSFKKAKMLITLALRFMLFLTIPFVVILSVYAEPVIRLLFGSQFSGASSFLMILSSAMGFLTVLYVCGFAFIGAGKGYIPAGIATSALVLNGALLFLGAEKYGTLGFVGVKLFVAILVFFAVLFFIYRVFGAHLLFREIGISVFAGVVIYGIACLFPISILYLFVISPIIFSLYVGILLYFKVLSQEDLQVVKNKI